METSLNILTINKTCFTHSNTRSKGCPEGGEVAEKLSIYKNLLNKGDGIHLPHEHPTRK